jgi:hypothetical protein
VSIPQVGQGSVAVVPTFRGFRKRTDAEFASSAKAGKSLFDRGFSSAGLSAGKGFSKSFQSAAKGLTSASLRDAQADVAKASREVAALRHRELDATGKVRVAEASLAEARRRYASDSSQVVRAEERLASVQRTSLTAKSNLLGATQRLTQAQRDLAGATSAASASGGRAGGVFANLTGIFGNAGRNGASRFSQGFKDVLGGVLGANILTGIGYTIGRTIGNGIRTGFDYTLQSITLASDLEQSMGAVTAQFKGQAEAIFDASKVAATSVGLSRATYQQYASIVGAQLKNLGLREEAVSGQTIDLIGLGADLAAQFGGPTSQAVEALSSLLRGERDPIERYGVSLKQQDINARLAANGMAELTGEAEKQATIQATLELLWEQTRDSQGTFFREQDTFAGKQQRLMAQLTDAQTEFGNTLLPTAIDVLEFANDDLLPILKSTLAEAGPQISESLRAVLPEIEETLRALGRNLPELIDFGGAVSGAIADSISGDLSPGGIIGGFGEDGVLTRQQEIFDQSVALTKDHRYDIEQQWGLFIQWWDLAWDGHADTVENTSREIQGYWRSGALNTLLELEAQAKEFISIGELWGEGLAEGFRNSRLTVRKEAALLAGEAIYASRGAMGIESPSKVAKEQGLYWGEGLALGIGGDESVRLVQAAAAGLTLAAQGDQPGGAGGAGGLGGGDRPIYMDGSLFGILREVASGEARIVLNDEVARAVTAKYGR